MDDARKIAALMIYYQHWGKEEIRARRAAHGWDRTRRLLDEHLWEGGETLLERTRRFVSAHSVSNIWVELMDVLLGGECIGWGEEYAEEEDLLFDRKTLLEENLGFLGDISVGVLYDDGFQWGDVLSVDAIVALPPLHHKTDFWPWDTEFSDGGAC